MKKISIVAMPTSEKVAGLKLTIGLDLGDRSSWYCVVEQSGQMLLEEKVSTTPKALCAVFGRLPRSRIALETGMHSPWVSRLLISLGTRPSWPMRATCV